MPSRLPIHTLPIVETIQHASNSFDGVVVDDVELFFLLSVRPEDDKMKLIRDVKLELGFSWRLYLLVLKTLADFFQQVNTKLGLTRTKLNVISFQLDGTKLIIL